MVKRRVLHEWAEAVAGETPPPPREISLKNLWSGPGKAPDNLIFGDRARCTGDARVARRGPFADGSSLRGTGGGGGGRCTPRRRRGRSRPPRRGWRSGPPRPRRRCEPSAPPRPSPRPSRPTRCGRAAASLGGGAAVFDGLCENPPLLCGNAWQKRSSHAGHESSSGGCAKSSFTLLIGFGAAACSNGVSRRTWPWSSLLRKPRWRPR